MRSAKRRAMRARGHGSSFNTILMGFLFPSSHVGDESNDVVLMLHSLLSFLLFQIVYFGELIMDG